MDVVGCAGIRPLSRLSAGPPGRVSGALQHHPHQRHALFPRPRSVGRRCRNRAALDAVSTEPDAPIRVWSAGCAVGPGGLYRRDPVRRAAGTRGVPRPRQDLRDRRRRRGADRSAARQLHAQADRRSSRGLAREVLRPERRTVHGQTRAAPRCDLRASRSSAGRADLPRRSAAVPQYADVLQRRGAGAHHVRVLFFASTRADTWSSGARKCSSVMPRCSSRST